MITYGVVAPKNAQWQLNDKFGTLVDNLAPHFDHIFFLASAPTSGMYKDPDSLTSFTYNIQASSVEVIALPASSANSHLVSKLIVAIWRLYPFYRYIRSSDFVYITMPGFSPFFAHIICRLQKKPYCLYFGADWQEVAPFMAKWNGPWAPLMRLYTTLSGRAEKAAVRHSKFVIVHGKKLLDKFVPIGVPVVETIPITLISSNQFYRRKDTCTASIIKILFVGSLIQRKGIEYLIDACQSLVEQGYNIQLQIVGTGEKGYVTSIKQRANLLNKNQRVFFSGYVSNLEELLQIYRCSDIFVLPSQGEGFPRVIYEAMSQCLPVVTTNIETIEAMIDNEVHAILIPPRSADALAKGIEKIITESELRGKLIATAYHFAKERIGLREPSSQLIELIAQYGIQESQ